MNCKNKEIAFLIIADKNITKQTLILLESIKKTYKKHEYSIFVATENSEIQRYRDYDESINLILAPSVDSNENKKLINKNITNFTFLRLRLFEIFNNIPTDCCCVYLDYDVFFRKKIKSKYINSYNNIAFVEYFDQNKINNSLLYWKGVISSPLIYSKIKISILNKRYFNAGVLIINNRKSFNALCRKINDSLYTQDDQTLLNFFLNNEFDIVEDYKSNNRVLNNFIKSSSIFHFSGAQKPWSCANLKENDYNLFNKCKKIGYFKLEEKVNNIEAGRKNEK